MRSGSKAALVLRLSAWKIFTVVGWQEYLFALLVLFLARPLAIGRALIASPLDWRERLAAAWFGPRGFASVVYGLLILSSGVYRAQDYFQVISIVIIGSMVAHSTTDVLMARWFKNKSNQKDREKNEPRGRQEKPSSALEKDERERIRQ